MESTGEQFSDLPRNIFHKIDLKTPHYIYHTPEFPLVVL